MTGGQNNCYKEKRSDGGVLGTAASTRHRQPKKIIITPALRKADGAIIACVFQRTTCSRVEAAAGMDFSVGLPRSSYGSFESRRNNRGRAPLASHSGSRGVTEQLHPTRAQTIFQEACMKEKKKLKQKKNRGSNFINLRINTSALLSFIQLRRHSITWTRRAASSVKWRRRHFSKSGVA